MKFMLWRLVTRGSSGKGFINSPAAKDSRGDCFVKIITLTPKIRLVLENPSSTHILIIKWLEYVESHHPSVLEIPGCSFSHRGFLGSEVHSCGNFVKTAFIFLDKLQMGRKMEGNSGEPVPYTGPDVWVCLETLVLYVLLLIFCSSVAIIIYNIYEVTFSVDWGNLNFLRCFSLQLLYVCHHLCDNSA